MARCFKQLNLQDRTKLFDLLRHKTPVSQIAKIIGVHRSTIYRELNRNFRHSGRLMLCYTPHFAQQLTLERKQRPLKLARDAYAYLADLVIYLLKLTWSPAQIAGYLKKESGSSGASHEAIYRFIFSPEGKKLGLHKFLRSKKKKRTKINDRKSKPGIPNRVSIHERPEYINNRSEFGHWEADLMQFRRESNCHLLTLRERKTRKTFGEVRLPV